MIRNSYCQMHNETLKQIKSKIKQQTCTDLLIKILLTLRKTTKLTKALELNNNKNQESFIELDISSKLKVKVRRN